MRILAIGLVCGLLAMGCASGTTNVNPNPEKSLQKTPTQFAEYAKQQAYPTTAPAAAKSPVRCEVDYGFDVLNFVNLGEQDLRDLQVWVNGKYVCYIAALPVKQQRGINFEFFYDNEGHRAPTKGNWIEKVELLHEGTLQRVTVRNAD